LPIRTPEFLSAISDNKYEADLICDRCVKVGIAVQLGYRLYAKGEAIPDDFEMWRQCHRCGKQYAIYEVRGRTAIKGFKEPLSDPFNKHGQDMRTAFSDKKNKKRGYKTKIKISESYLEEDDEEIRLFKEKGSIVKV